MPSVPNLTGRWTGFYSQHGHERPIRAELVQNGDRLTGTMTDAETECETTVFEMASEAGLPPGADEQIEGKLREAFPEAPRGPIRAAWRLPAESVLVGSVRAGVVQFRKTYQGQSFSGYRIGDQRVGITRPGHRVNYRGEVDAGGTVIEGRWWVEADGSGVLPGQGGFRLERSPAPSASL
jgi:hypothetical protein